MKKLTFALLLLVLALALTFTACDGGTAPDVTSDTAVPTDEPTAAPTDIPADVPTEELTEEPTEEVTTEAPTEEITTETPTEAPTEPVVEITDGMMLYYEDFSKYGDIEDNAAALEALGWVIQTVADDYAYSDWTANVAVKDGKLTVNNYDSAADFKGKDSYALMLGEDYMTPIAKYGDYTVQYDVTYTDAANYKRYICLLTDYFGDTYNSFHFRIGGYANNQGHIFGQWRTYDEVDPEKDLSCKLTSNDPAKGTTIAKKLLGIDADIKDAAAIEHFRNVTVTIRIQHDADLGNIVYMKTAEMADFICVSMPTETAEGAVDWSNIVGEPGLAFKVGGAINGYMDNIAMWAGLGEMPEDTTVTYVPSK